MIRIETKYSLLRHNTFGIDAKCSTFMEYNSVEELQKSLPIHTTNILHIGEGSNLLFKSDFNGVILHSLIKGITEVRHSNNDVYLHIGAGEKWDDVCEYAANNGLGGIENLSGIPGEAGAAAVQNIGAYGAEIKDVIQSVETVAVSDGAVRIFSVNECAYGYRESIFKSELRGKYIVTGIVIKLSSKPEFNLSYGSLQSTFKETTNLTVKEVRNEIKRTRDSKLPDPKHLGNAGSFFKNPIVPVSVFNALKESYNEIPHYMVGSQMVKIPAAWLIDQCEWKGKRINNVGVYDKQALVVVNYGGCTGNDIYEFAQAVIQSVENKFGITLYPEVNFIG